MIAHVSYLVSLSAEILNIYMLTYQHTVEHCIIHFVALEVLVEIPHIYMNSLVEDQLRVRVFENNKHLHVTNRGKYICFWNDRNLVSKIQRIVYRLHRALYVSIIFYFAPFICIIFYANIEGGIEYPDESE